MSILKNKNQDMMCFKANFQSVLNSDWLSFIIEA